VTVIYAFGGIYRSYIATELNHILIFIIGVLPENLMLRRILMDENNYLD